MIQKDEGRMSRTLQPGSLYSLDYCTIYVVQAFSIVSDIDPKEKDQIAMRKVCTFALYPLLRRPNKHFSSGEKHLTFLTFPWRVKIVYNATSIEQHCLGSMRAVHFLTWFKNGWTRSL